MRFDLLRRTAAVVAVLGVAAVGGILFIWTPSLAQQQPGYGIDLKQILRCGATDDAGKAACVSARDLIIANCTVCHTVAPIVLQQFDEGGWTGLLARHRERVMQLSDEQVSQIKTYLAANFNESQDPPELPPALLKAWTDY
jgi:hypothetical protein